MPTAAARDRTGAAALAGAAVTGLIAFALFLAGGLLLWANAHYKDADGYLSTGSERFSAPGYALTTDRLEAGRVSRGQYGTIRVTARSAEQPVFVGIAPTRDVNAYLRGVAHSEVADPFSDRTQPQTGTRRPARPATQRFWAASASGDGSQTLRWDVEDGDWSVVVMNENGSRGVSATVSAGAKVPYLVTFGVGTLALGLAFIVATAALTLYGTRPVPSRRPVALAA